MQGKRSTERACRLEKSIKNGIPVRVHFKPGKCEGNRRIHVCPGSFAESINHQRNNQPESQRTAAVKKQTWKLLIENNGSGSEKH